MSGSAKVIGAIDISDIFDKVEKDGIPEGYHSTSEISKATGRSISSTAAKLKKLRDDGAIECRRAIVSGVKAWVYKVNL